MLMRKNQPCKSRPQTVKKPLAPKAFEKSDCVTEPFAPPAIVELVGVVRRSK
jgi:hypothetical protein